MRRVIALIAVIFALAAAASAQQLPGADDTSPELKPRRARPLGSPEEEMLRRAEIEREEESHRDMVERADEAAHIGDELLESFKRNNTLTREDLKRLERLEKLARKIRGGAGGSDDDEKLDDPPARIEPAVTRLAKLAGDLKESVAKTSRLVTSAKVIERSNELIELIRHIRTFKLP